MLLNVIFLCCISVALANVDLFNIFLDSSSIEGNQSSYHRETREVKKKKDFEATTGPTCDQMSRTGLTPFVVLILFRTSGRFLGMGSIIDKTTVLTAAKAVENSVQTPRDMYVLAGRLGPWWGKNSQVKRCQELLVNDQANMAIIKLQNSFTFDKYVSPIKIPQHKSKSFKDDYDAQYAVFGIPRSSFDIPGDPTPKSSIYIMKVETLATKDEVLKPCKKAFPDRDFDDDANICTSANGTYCWGCIGSPTVAITKKGKVLQVATITKTTMTEKDLYHVHTKLGVYEQWIRSQSFINYDDEK